MQPQTQFLDLYRASLRTMNDAMKASLESAERLQNQQLQMLRTALDENGRSSSQLGEVKSLDELMALQTRLVGSQLERYMDFWSGLWRTAGDSQMSMISQMQSQLGQVRERVKETYAFTARATEDATRLAASQVATAASASRDASTVLREAAAAANQEKQSRKTA